jgi:WD40 repeat protein
MSHSAAIAAFIDVCIHDSHLSLRDLVILVLCYETCRAWQHELKSRGFSLGAAWLCVALGRGKDPRDLACRIRELHPWSAARHLDVADQVVRFLLRHQEGIKNKIVGAEKIIKTHGADRERRWAQLASQEPDDSFLARGIRGMSWFWKDQFIQQRFGKKPGYHCGVLAMPKTDGSTYIDEACISPDGKMFAQPVYEKMLPQGGEKATTVQVCEMSSGVEVRNMQVVPSYRVCGMAWSPNNKLLAVHSSRYRLEVFEKLEWLDVFDELGNTVWTRQTPCLPSVAGRVAWTMDSKYVIAWGSNDGIVHFWDFMGDQEFMLEHSTDTASLSTCFAVSNDGCMLAIGSTEFGEAFIASLIPLTQGTNPTKVCNLECEMDVICMAWSPDSMLLATGSERFGANFWSRAGEWLYSWSHHFKYNEMCMCWTHHDGNTEERTLKPDERCPVVGPYLKHPHALAFSPDGKTLACCGFSTEMSYLSDSKHLRHGVIRLWDVDNKQELGYIPESHTAEITNMIFLPD